MTDETYQRLLALMDEIYSALLTGDFDILPTLEAELITHADHFPKLAYDRLVILQGKAERNSRLLVQARRGIKSAQNRLHEIGKVQAGLSTYNEQGKSRISPSRNKFQKHF